MNIEESRSKLISFIDFYNKKPKEENRKFKMLQVDNIDIKAIETLITAYEEKSKELEKEIEELNKENTRQHELIGNIHKHWEDKIKAKIEEVKDGTYDAKIVLESLLEKE